MPVTLEPSKNSWILEGVYCQTFGCKLRAKVDAKSNFGSWAYFCLDHLKEYGTKNPLLITNITTQPLTIDWIRS